MSEHFVAETKKKERVHRILDLSRELEKKYYEKFVNEMSLVVYVPSKVLVLSLILNHLIISISSLINLFNFFYSAV